MIQEKNKLLFRSLRVLYQNENLKELLDKNKYDYITVISYDDLGLEEEGYSLKYKKLANIALNSTIEEILERFTRRTKQEVLSTYKVGEFEFKVADPNLKATYKLYKKFERAQSRKPWGKESFNGVINFNAYYKGRLVASVPCYDVFPYLQVRAIFSKRMEESDKGLYKLIGSATRRLIFEACKYGQERGYKFVSLGSVNYSTEQKANVANFKMFFGSELGDEYTYTYKSSKFMFLEKTRKLIKDMKVFRILNRYLERFITQKCVVGFIRKKTSNVVASGPFSGMKYVSSSTGSRLLPKILGTYELELHPMVEEICKRSFDVIVDVGAAEGYYAVGMALRNPKAKVIAFETEISGQNLIKKMADINGVTNRVFARGFCDSKLLSSSIPDDKKCLIIMDIEGGEASLLDNCISPKLNSCHILVEIHECVVSGVGDIIINRFKNTHNIIEIKERARVLKDFPLSIPILYRSLFKKYFILNSMDEARFDSLIGRLDKNTNWLYLELK
ncbi:hypothetical protein KJ671_01415 [Patescibacteria group bacterium]|nr:hypothetical protein [Patescibacteria group bacterium]